MDLNAAIDIIVKDLTEASGIIDDLKNYPGIPVLQIELAKSKCMSAAGLIALLKDLQKSDIRGQEARQIIRENIAGDTKPADKVTPDVSVISENTVTMESKEIFQKEIITSPVPDTVTMNKEATVSNGKKTALSSTIADQYAGRPSFNEQLGGRIHDDDILEKLKTKPVTSLSEAIGVNDKFLFIREIFNNNYDAYNQAIFKLDAVHNLTEATEIITSFSGENTDAEVVRILMDIVKRKFPPHE